MGQLEGKVAIVTGAAGEIGEATARLLASEGAFVVVADVNLPGAEVVVSHIRDEGGEALAVSVDISNEEQVVAMVEQATALYGHVDILHNNAALHGPPGAQLVEDMDVAVWDQTFAVNARGTMLCTKHTLRRMVASGGGSIINMHSVDGLRGDFARTAYGASKSALTAFTKAVATQYATRGIRCNAIAPGMTFSMERRARYEGYSSLEPHFLLPVAFPHQQASVVLFLASDAASYVTGQVIPVDGGLLAHFPWYAQLRAAAETT